MLLVGWQEEHPACERNDWGGAVWSEVLLMTCKWYSWCHCHSIISVSENPERFILLVPAYLGCTEKRLLNDCYQSCFYFYVTDCWCNSSMLGYHLYLCNFDSQLPLPLLEGSAFLYWWKLGLTALAWPVSLALWLLLESAWWVPNRDQCCLVSSCSLGGRSFLYCWYSDTNQHGRAGIKRAVPLASGVWW